MPYLSANSWFGLGVEATRGTPVSPAFYIPVLGPKWEPKETWLEDKGLRGSPVEIYDEVPSVRHDEWTGKFYLYPDSAPNFFRALLGSTDTITGTTAPYSHKIGLLNAASTGSQPPSYTLVNFDVVQQRQLAAAQMSDLTLTFAANAAVELQGTFITNIESDITSASNNPSSTHLVPGWDVSVTLGTVASSVVVSGEVAMKRNTAAIFTVGTQGPYRNWAAPLVVTGKLVFVVESGDLTLANGLARDQQKVTLLFTEPVSGYTVQIVMDACQFKDPVIDQSKPYIEVSTNFSAVANTTDAVSGGYSPIVTTTSNGQSTAY